MHDVADPHETLLRRLSFAPAGLGVGCTDHDVPFHRSARVTMTPWLLV
jgi:hypothetical protein